MTPVARLNIPTARALATLPPLAPAVAIFVEQGRTPLTDATDPARIAERYECTGLQPAQIGLRHCLLPQWSRHDSVVGFAATTAEIHDVSQRKPVNKAKNDWRCLCNCVVSTDG
uniref:Uncharacterized protein n=1 Tax=Romanomermis culicivorax TaxID=13658 RepID=A0A915L2S4_ROMCU